MTALNLLIKIVTCDIRHAIFNIESLWIKEELWHKMD
jgi:hypothetical protein